MKYVPLLLIVFSIVMTIPYVRRLRKDKNELKDLAPLTNLWGLSLIMGTRYVIEHDTVALLVAILGAAIMITGLAISGKYKRLDRQKRSK